MATRLYLRAALAATSPTAGNQSTTYPQASPVLFNANSGTGFEDLSLSTTKGTAQTSKALNSQASTAAGQDFYVARFSSEALAAQTIAANTWTFAMAHSEANVNANNYHVFASLYVWRPSTTAVVGYVYDGGNVIGGSVEMAATEDGRVGTQAMSAVTAAAGDILVYECWFSSLAQAMATAYAQTLYFDGTTDVVDTTTTDAASYIETPQNLTFGGAAAVPGFIYRRGPNYRR